jgi:hypothetical protein
MHRHPSPNRHATAIAPGRQASDAGSYLAAGSNRSFMWPDGYFRRRSSRPLMSRSDCSMFFFALT